MRKGATRGRRVETARRQVAALVGGDPALVTFTSGGTEANNTVLTADWHFQGKPHRAERLLIGATEHPSVLAGGRFAADAVHAIPVDETGVVRLDSLERLLAELSGEGIRPLVSVMLANNETGVIQPVVEVADLAHQAGAIVHTDAVQAVGRIPIDSAALGVDVLTLSAHKIGGPQGAGAILRASDSLSFAPLLVGGGQEKRFRAGTENVAAIAGFGAAAEASRRDLGTIGDLASMRDGLSNIIQTSVPEAVVFGADAERLPQTLCLGIPGVMAETLVIALDLAGIAVSSGAACSSGKVASSHVLEAMGVDPDAAKTAIRLSLGWQSDTNTLDSFASAWQRVLRQVLPGRFRAA